MIESRNIKKTNDVILDSVVECLREGVDVKLQPKGSSMYPFIREETDHVMLSSVDIFMLKRNQIVLYKRENGQYVLHRIIKVNEDTVDARGDAQRLIEKNIPINTLLGIVTVIVRNGREIKVDALSQKLLFFVWSILLPIRGRLVLWIKKVLNG